VPDGRLFTSSWDKTIRCWNPETGDRLATLEGHTGTVSHLSLMTDGGLASVGHDRALRIWDIGYQPPMQIRSALKTGH
jgi:WD40 repeat protein